MSLFPITQYDFPNVSEYDSDLRELIAMYKKLVSDYSFLVKDLTDLLTKYDELSNKYTEIQNAYSTLNTVVQNHIADSLARFGVIDDRILTLVNGLDNTNATIVTITDNLSTAINDLMTYVDSQDQEVIRGIRAEIQTEISDLQDQIDDLEFDLPPIYNPFRGIASQVAEFAKDVWQWLRYGAYTAAQFDSAANTAEQLDGYGATAIEWDTRGKIILLGTIDRW